MLNPRHTIPSRNRTQNIQIQWHLLFQKVSFEIYGLAFFLDGRPGQRIPGNMILHLQKRHLFLFVICWFRYHGFQQESATKHAIYMCQQGKKIQRSKMEEYIFLLCFPLWIPFYSKLTFKMTGKFPQAYLWTLTFSLCCNCFSFSFFPSLHHKCSNLTSCSHHLLLCSAFAMMQIPPTPLVVMNFTHGADNLNPWYTHEDDLHH